MEIIIEKNDPKVEEIFEMIWTLECQNHDSHNIMVGEHQPRFHPEIEEWFEEAEVPLPVVTTLHRHGFEEYLIEFPDSETAILFKTTWL